MEISININSKNFKLNFILIAILIIASVLRFYKLDFQGVWLDELHTLKEADPDWSLKMLHEVNMFREGIPHLYFLIVRFFGILFGHSIYSVRLVSVIFGILAVYGIYLVGKKISGKQTGYITAFLLAIHPFHIEYSQDGRSYSMLICFVIIAFYRLLIFLENYSIKNAIFLGIFLGLITNAHPVGIVSVISVFLLIGLYFFKREDKQERIKYFKSSFITGIVTLIVFSPVYQKVVNASSITSFWVQKPSYDYVIYVLKQIVGGSDLLIIIFAFSILALLIFIIESIIKNRDYKTNDNLKKFIVVFIWVMFYFLFILIKSLGPSSLILGRYLSPILPGLILSIAILISQFKNRIIINVLSLAFGYLLLHSLIVDNDYYNTRVKSQFNDISLQILKENKYHEVVISNWGWLLGFYLDKDVKLNNVYEKNLDVYINDVKTKSVEQENFWYVDGNSRPYLVNPETQEFLDNNYTIDKKIDLHDCWAKHYISNNLNSNTDKHIKLNQFRNAQFDGSGNLLFFENSKSSSAPIILEKGQYDIEITSLSQPKVKINNENAKFIIFINDKNYGTFESNEGLPSTLKINFHQAVTSNFEMDIVFINDFSKDNLDRNLQISKIELLRK